MARQRDGAPSNWIIGLWQRLKQFALATLLQLYQRLRLSTLRSHLLPETRPALRMALVTPIGLSVDSG